jgi:hypothetical protein
MGINAGFAVLTGDSTYGHVYSHVGWTATTVAGNPAWTNYTMAVAVKPSAWLSESNSVEFRYLDAAHYYAVRFIGGTTIELVCVNGGTTTDLARVTDKYSASWHQVVITASGSSLRVSLDGRTIQAATDPTFSSGAIAFGANSPVEFANVSIS